MIYWQIKIGNSVTAIVSAFLEVLVFVRNSACEGLVFWGWYCTAVRPATALLSQELSATAINVLDEAFRLKVVWKNRNIATGMHSASVSAEKITLVETHKSKEKETCLVYVESVMWPEPGSQI